MEIHDFVLYLTDVVHYLRYALYGSLLIMAVLVFADKYITKWFTPTFVKGIKVFVAICIICISVAQYHYEDLYYKTKLTVKIIDTLGGYLLIENGLLAQGILNKTIDERVLRDAWNEPIIIDLDKYSIRSVGLEKALINTLEERKVQTTIRY